MRLLEDEATRGPYASRISVLRNTEATDIQRDATGRLSVTLRNTHLDSSMTFVPNLLLGCDGINSIVRNTMHMWAAGQQGSSNGKERFSMVLAPSLSTNLRFKVLQLPPNPAMVDGTVLNNPSFSLLAGQKAPLIGEAAQSCWGQPCTCM
jgi:2-polyprenyl-6-methoxyphenol hydroxylase-like FAD-dependent oxidoreductase